VATRQGKGRSKFGEDRSEISVAMLSFDQQATGNATHDASQDVLLNAH